MKKDNNWGAHVFLFLLSQCSYWEYPLLLPKVSGHLLGENGPTVQGYSLDDIGTQEGCTSVGRKECGKTMYWSGGRSQTDTQVGIRSSDQWLPLCVPRVVVLYSRAYLPTFPFCLFCLTENPYSIHFIEQLSGMEDHLSGTSLHLSTAFSTGTVFSGSFLDSLLATVSAAKPGTPKAKPLAVEEHLALGLGRWW